MISPEAATVADVQEELHLELAGTGSNADHLGEHAGTSSASSAGQQHESQSRSNEYSAILGDIEVPEGVDPSFLAALPESMRQEVIQDHLRMQRLRQQNQSSTSSASAAAAAATAQGAQSSSSDAPPSASSSSFTEVNPEFLAALPPNIQEEVLAQQRAEQQRLASQNQAPDEPADASAFFLTLPAALRQTILQDLDDSLLPILPPDLAQEAQTLRAQALQQREILQDRLFSTHGGTSTLSRILRTAVNRMGSAGVTRYTIHNLPLRPSGRGGSSAWAWNAIGGSHMVRHRNVSRQLIDFEALSCLLVLLFVDEPRLNTNRLHKVLRNLAYNEATRLWLVRALLSMIESVNRHVSDELFHQYFNKKTAASWLSISLDAALGCKTNIFHIYNGQVMIHPQAANMVCRHALDTLISLGKAFPKHFMPSDRHSRASGIDQGNSKQTDFWSLIVKLEQQSRQGSSAKGKHLSTPSRIPSSKKGDDGPDIPDEDGQQQQGTLQRDSRDVMKIVIESMTGSQFKASPLFQLILLLAHPVIQNSQLLTDRLLRLLALVVIAVEDRPGSIAADRPAPTTAISAAGSDTPGSAAAAAAAVETTTDQQASSSRAPPAPTDDTAEVPSDSDGRIHDVDGETEQILESHLKLAVNTLTSKSCSEAGLEDATALLLKLSKGSSVVRKVVLKLLLDGARQLGHTVCEHIRQLENELRGLSETADSEKPGPSSRVDTVKGVIQDRFTSGSVVICSVNPVGRGGSSNATARTSSRELQLASMAALTSKTSNQAFLLRVLKVIIQLRSCAQQNGNSNAVGNHTAINRSNRSIASLSHELALDALWNKLSDCLTELADAPDQHAVLVLQPAVEAFFLVHAASFRNALGASAVPGGSAGGVVASGSASAAVGASGSTNAVSSGSAPADPSEPMIMEPSELVLEMPPVSPPDVVVRRSGHDDDDAAAATGAAASGSSGDSSNADMSKFLNFAETHRMVLNQILRQSTVHLPDGPFAVLVDHTRILDFDVKRKYFRTELEKTDVSGRREDVAIHVKRELVFEDSYRELHRRPPEDWKNRLYIVFEGEEGQVRFPPIKHLSIDRSIDRT